MPKSVATATIHPSVVPSDTIPNASRDNRRAASTVTAKNAALPAMSEIVRYVMSAAVLSRHNAEGLKRNR